MKNCAEYEDQFIEAFYGELATAAREEFEQHLETCPQCGTSFKELERTLQAMDLAKPAPPPDSRPSSSRAPRPAVAGS